MTHRKKPNQSISLINQCRFRRGAVRLAGLLTGLGVLIGSAAEAQNRILVDNFGQPASGSLFNVSLNASDVSNARAQAFTTGPAGYQLRSVTLYVDQFSGALGERMRVDLYSSDSDDKPDAQLLRFGGNGTQGNLTKTFDVPAGDRPYALAANTTYNIVVIATEESSSVISAGFSVGRTTSDEEDGSSAPDWSIRNRAWSRSSGGTNWTAPDIGSFRLRINGAIVNANVATGAPEIIGVQQVGQGALTVDTSGIMDDDGLDDFTRNDSYQWIRVNGGNEADIPGATGDTYTLTADDVGARLKVAVSFEDDHGSEEGPLTSVAWPAIGEVVAAATDCATITTDWCSMITVGKEISNNAFFDGYSVSNPAIGTIDDNSISYPASADFTAHVNKVLQRDPLGSTTLEVKLDTPAPRDSAFTVAGRLLGQTSGDRTRFFTNLNNRLSWFEGQRVTASVVLGNFPATVDGSLIAVTDPMGGDPAVGVTLASVANTTRIMDYDGRGDAGGDSVLQWVVEDVDGANRADILDEFGAPYTARTYVVRPEDAGRNIRVEWNFTDGRGNAEAPLDEPVTIPPYLTLTGPGTVSEAATEAVITVTLTPAVTGTVSVDYITQNGTATAAGQFTPEAGMLEFAPGDTTRQIDISLAADNDIYDDPAPNRIRAFDVALSSLAGATLLSGSDDHVSIIIEDDEGRPTWSVSADDVTEGDPMTVTLSLDHGSYENIDFLLNRNRVKGSARPGLDYVDFFAPGAFNISVRIPAGMTQQTLIFATIDDEVEENTETIFFDNWTRVGNTLNGILQDVTSRIMDNDAGTRGVTVTPQTLEVTEDGTADYTIVLDTPPNLGTGNNQTGEVTVTVTPGPGDVSLDGAALDGALALVFTLDNWDTPQTVKVRAADDADSVVDDPVALTHAVTGAATGYAGFTVPDVTVSIIENEANLVLSTNRTKIVEPRGTPSIPGSNATLTVEITNDALLPVDTDIVLTFAGSADVGADFTVEDANGNTLLPPYTLTLPAMETKVTGRIVPVDNNIYEGLETLEVTASFTLDAVATVIGPQTIVIDDEGDRAQVSQIASSDVEYTPGGPVERWPIEFIILFDRVVSGLEAHELQVTNGRVVSLERGGFARRFDAIIQPTGEAGEVLTVHVPANVVDGGNAATLPGESQLMGGDVVAEIVGTDSSASMALAPGVTVPVSEEFVIRLDFTIPVCYSMALSVEGFPCDPRPVATNLFGPFIDSNFGDLNDFVVTGGMLISLLAREDDLFVAEYDLVIRPDDDREGELLVVLPEGSAATGNGGRAGGAQLAVEVDTLAPRLLNAVVDGATLTLYWHEAIAAAPAADVFTVTVDGAAVAVDGVAVNGLALELTLASAVTTGAVVVSYAMPAVATPVVTGIADAAGNEVASFTGRAATIVNTAVAPVLDSARISGAVLSLTYDQPLDETSTPAASAFTVTVADAAASVSAVSVSGILVNLTLAEAVQAGQAVLLSYAVPSGDPIGNAAGLTAAALSGQAVTNDTPVTVPVLQTAAVNGTELILIYSEALDPGSVPATGDFTVKLVSPQQGNTPTVLAVLDVSAVNLVGTTVVLTLSDAAAFGNEIQLDYRRRMSPIRDVGGTRAAALSGYAVTNVIPDPGPMLVNAVATGSTVTLNYDEPLDESSAPVLPVFTLVVPGATDLDPTAVNVTGTTVVLTFAAPIPSGAGISYEPDVYDSLPLPPTPRIQDTAGTAAPQFSLEPVLLDIVPVQVSFLSTTGSVAEGGSTDIAVALSADPQRTVEIPLTLAYSDGASMADVDTAAFPPSITFAGGQTVRTVTLTAADDPDPEKGETVILGFGSLPEGVGVGSQNTSAIAIIDDDPPAQVTGVTVTPGNESLQVDWTPVDTADGYIVQWAPSSAPIPVTEHVIGNGATTGYRITGLTNGTEYDVRVIATRTALANGPASDPAVSGTPTRASLAISDATAQEGDNLTFTVTLTPAVADQVTVSYATSDGTATAGDDYTAVAGTLLTFAPGVTEQTFTVAALSDAVDENDETFTVTLSGASSNAEIATATATGRIEGGPTLLSLTVTEGGLNGAPVGLSSPFTASVSNYTASVARDITGVTVVAPAADAAASVAFSFTDSDPLAGGHQAALAFGDNELGITVTLDGRSRTYTITVTRALPELGFDEPDHRVGEGDGEVVLTVNLDPPYPTGGDTVTVDYAATSGTATEGEDYTATPGTLSFAPGETSKMITVPLLDNDNHADDRLEFSVVLSGVSGATLPGPNASVRIANNDVVTASTVVTETVSGNNENRTLITEGEDFAIRLQLDRMSASDISYTIGNVNITGTAVVGTDFNFTGGGAGQRRISVTAGMLLSRLNTIEDLNTFTSGHNDLVAEPDKTIIMNWASGNTSMLEPPTIPLTITIIDDDPPAPVTATVTPGDARLTAGWAAADFATGYKVQWKSGVEGFADAATGGREAVIGDGAATSHTITGLTNDIAYDVRVIATRTLTNATEVESAASAPVTETPTVPVGLSIAVAAPADEGGEITFTVTLSPAASGPVTVDYATSDDTATAGADYTAASGALTFAAGDGPKTFTVATTVDTDAEPDETFTVTLSNPTVGAVIATGAGTATGTIVDDDPPAPVTGVTVSTPPSQNHALAVVWDAAAFADGYIVQWRYGHEKFEDANADGREAVLPSGTTAYTITGLLEDAATYHVQVIATRTLSGGAQVTGEPSGQVDGVTDGTPVVARPVLLGARAEGVVLTMIFDLPLDETAVPSPQLFAIVGVDPAIDSREATVTVNGVTVILTVPADRTLTPPVTISYQDTDGHAPGSPLLRAAETGALVAEIFSHPVVANYLATGAPVISGTAQVGEVLTTDADADGIPDGIVDDNGLTAMSAGFTWQWVRMDADGMNSSDIAGATLATYALTPEDAGGTVGVRVSFTDDDNYAETLTSAAWPPGGTVVDPALGICGRTAEVRDELLLHIASNEGAPVACADVTAAHLTAITGALDLAGDVTALAVGDFAGLTALPQLYLNNNALATLPAGVFDGLTSLTLLSLYDNALATLPDDVFDGLTSLTMLSLYDNALATLPVGVFDGLTALTMLSLYENDLTTLPAGVFAGLTALERLRLDDNDLSTLPVGVFDGLTALRELFLDDNDLSTLPVGVFDGLTALRELFLDDNDLSTLPVGVFDGPTALTTLWLRHNALATLPVGVFDRLTSLTLLLLDNNKLTTLPAGVFDGPTALRDLFLDNNELTTLPDDVFELLTALTILNLSNNPGPDNDIDTDDFAPVADAQPDDGTVLITGGDVMLDGSGSDGGPWGDNVTYGWALTDPASGVTVTFNNGASAMTEVTIPALTAGTELTFTLTVTGAGGESGFSGGIAPDTDTATVTATAPTNADPVFTDTTPVTRSFDEDEGDSTKSLASNIGLPVAATDADAGDTLTYALGGTDAASFGITTTGQITTKPHMNYDHETTPSYAVTVTVTDGNGGSAIIAVTIDVNDVAERPFQAQTPTVSATAGSTMSLDVSWNSSNNTGRPAITYDLQYRPGTTVAFTPGPQSVDMRSAVIMGLAPDTQYQVQVRATNADGDGDWSASGSGTTAPPPGEVLVSNTAETMHSVAQTVGNSFPGLTAQGFTTGSEAHGYELNSVGIHVTEDNRSAGEIFTVEVYRFDNADPIYKLGALVHTLTTPGTIIEGAVNNFAAPAGATLLPDTRYLITFTGDGDSNGDFTIARTFSDAQTGVAGWLIDNNFLSAGLSTTTSLLINVRGAVRSDAGNTTATGAPAITGMAQVGRTLTATPDTIADADGLTSPGYAYQWQRVDSDGTSNPEDIADATAVSYAVTSADAGRQLRVAVSFRDDAGYAEGPLFSTATATVECESGVLWCATLTVQGLGSGDRGCTGTGADDCSDHLSDNTFTYDTTDYDIRQLRLQSGGQLRLVLDPDITAGSQSLILHVRDAEFAFADADTPLAADRREWSSSGLSWSNGDSVEVKLTKAPPSDDATLSGLTVNDGTSDLTLDPPTFAAGTFDYAVSVANAVTSITIAPTLSDSNATVEYLNENDAVIPDTNPGTPALDAALAEGDNVINVRVTAADDNTTQTYTVTVMREAADVPELSISALATGIAEGDPVSFTLSRTGDTAAALTVTVEISESLDGAFAPTDTATFAAGSATAALLLPTDSDTAGTTANTVTATIPVSPDGAYVLVADAASASVTVFDPAAGICLRTPAVRDALLAAIPGVTDCVDVTAIHLVAITGSLDVSGESITALAAGDFAGLTGVTILDLSDTGLTTLPAGVFDGLTALTVLYLYENDLTTLPAGVFEPLTALGVLELDRNDLTTLPAGVFDGLTALTVLYLYENDLTTLPAGVFEPLTALETLGLFDNQLSTLPAGVFDGLPALTALWLYNNQLSTLPAGVFDGLTALTVLYLHRNALATLPAGVFEPLTALTDLRLTGNPGAPFAPVADALPDDGTVSTAGGTVTLTGSDGGPWGDNVTYRWATTTSGVTFDDNTSATPVATIPMLADDTVLTFTLTVTGAGHISNGTAPATDTATVRVLDPANTAASGAPVITGAPLDDDGNPEPQHGLTLTVDTSGISDADGLTAPGYMYQWIRVDGSNEDDIPGATVATYTAVLADVGMKLKVRVDFTDDGSAAETLTSTATASVVAQSVISFGSSTASATEGDVAGVLLTVRLSPYARGSGIVQIVSEGQNGATPADYITDVTVSFNPSDISKTFRVTALDDVDDDDGESVKISLGMLPPWMKEGADAEATVTLIDTDNTPATGAPVISGAAQVGEVLTADTGGIADADGLTSPGYTYQWIRVDEFGTETNIGADAGAYTLVAADAGGKIRVQASFTDDADNPEALTSDAWPAGAATINTAPVFAGVAPRILTLTETVGDATVAVALDIGAPVAATDADGDTLEYTLGGPDMAKFGIVPTSGQIQTLVGESYDYEAKTSYSVTVTADDRNGGTALIAVTINVNDLEPPLAPDAPVVVTIMDFPDSLIVEWTQPDNTDRPAITGYDLRYRKTTENAWIAGPGDESGLMAFILNLVEDTEYEVQVRATNGEGDSPWSQSGTGTTDALPALSFVSVNVEVAENEGVGMVGVELDRTSLDMITVDYQTQDSTAVAGVDYTATMGTLTFAPGVTSQAITIPILDNDTFEAGAPGSFRVMLGNPAGATLDPSSAVATVSIRDDEGVPMASIADVTAGEGGTMRLTLTLDHPSSLDTAYGATAGGIGGTATRGVDYEDDFLTGGSVSFTVPAGDLSATLAITITDDMVAEDDETITIRWTLDQSSNRGEATPVSLDFTGAITDDDAAGVTVSETALTVTEEDTTGDSYTVVLDSRPTANVMVTVAGHAGTDVTPTPTPLIFTSLDWDTPRTVTVTAVSDADTANDTVTLTHSATSSDGDYSSIAIPGVTVTVLDNDTAQVTGVMVTEGNGQLVVEWTAVSNATGYRVQWKSGGEDYNTGDRQATVTPGSTTSHTIGGLANGAEYTVRVIATRSGANDGPPSAEVMGTPEEPTAPGVTVSESALTVTEEDTTGDSYTVVLDTEPTADVTVTVAGHAGTDVTPNPTTLTFTSLDWNTPQEVRVTAGDDGDTDNETVTLTHSATSSDGDYSSIAIPGVTVTVLDNDTAQVTGVMVTEGNGQLVVEWTAVSNATGYKVQWKSGGEDYNTGDRQATVTPGSTISHTIGGLANGAEYTVRVIATRSGANDGPPSAEVMGMPEEPGVTVSGSPLTVTEEDTTGDSYTVVLDTEPTADVTVTVAGHAGTDVTPTPTPLIFTSTTWSTPQEVRVTAGDDGDTDNETVTLTHSATSSDGDYSSIAIPGVTVTVLDNDTAQVTGVMVTEGNGQLVVEWTAVSNATGYRVQWKSDGEDYNTGDRQATVTPGSTISHTIGGLANGAEYMVRVIATRSGANDGPPSAEVMGMPEEPTAPGVTVSGSPLTVTEEDTTGDSYTVVLDTEPTADVTVTVAGHAGTDVTPNPTTLTFTSLDWDTPRTVTVTADNDGDTDNETVTLTHSATSSDGDYSSIAIPGVTVTVLDTTNTPATGAPVISGTAQVGEVLTATTGGIADADGLPGSFTWQWLRVDSDSDGVSNETMIGANAATYTLAEADEGARIRVRVSFTDDAGNPEALTSAAWPSSGMIAPPATPLSTDATLRALALAGANGGAIPLNQTFAPTLTAYTADVANGVGQITLTPTLSDDTAMVAYLDASDTVIDDANMTTPGFQVALTEGANEIRVRVTAEDDSTTQTYMLTVTRAANTPATGEPLELIAGGSNPPQVGETLTVNHAAIVDPDGKPDPMSEPDEYSYQWFHATTGPGARALSPDVGTPIPGATSATYTLDEMDLGARIRVRVSFTDDAGNPETLTSAATGAVIAAAIPDRTAPVASWLPRFGRTVSEQVVETAQARMAATPVAGLAGQLAGQTIAIAPGRGSAEARADAEADFAALGESFFGAGDATGNAWDDTGDGRDGAAERGYSSRALTGRDFLTGSAFALTGDSGDSAATLWGRGAVTSFDGRDGSLSLDGEVVSGMLGIDWRNGERSGGLMLSRSRGEGDYRSSAAGGAASDDGRISATLTGLYPWLGHRVNDRLTLWGVAGYGRGTLTLTPAGEDALSAGIGLTMGSVGARGRLGAGAEGMVLAWEADALALRTTSDAASGAEGRLDATSSGVTRLRLGLTGSRRFRLGSGAALTPGLEVGLRHDGGDAETGYGTDIGVSLDFADPARGITAAVSARGLLDHAAQGFRERGLSATLTWDQRPGSDLGWSLSLGHGVGAATEGGAASLLARQSLAGLLTGDGDDGDDTTEGNLQRRFDATLGYGVPMAAGRFVAVSGIGFGLTDAGREYSVGWRLGLARSGPMDLHLRLEATRQESTTGSPTHDLGLDLGAAIRW